MDHMPITYIYFWLKHIKEITKQVQTAPFQMVQSLNYFFSPKMLLTTANPERNHLHTQKLFWVY